MLEAQALHGVRQFDVDAQVVGIELEFIAGADAAVLGHVEDQLGHGAVDGKLPVPVARRLGAEIHRRFAAGIAFGHGRHYGATARGGKRALFRLVQSA